MAIYRLVSWQPERAFVITLPRRTDREGFVADLAALVPHLEVIHGVDGLEPADRRDWRSSAGAWGNRESHRRILQAAAGVDSVLVFEDDALAPAHLLDAMDHLIAMLPQDWEVLMLGGEHVRPPLWVAPGLVRCVRTIRTHAYVARGEGIALLADIAQRSTRHWDHALARTLGLRGRTYAPDPFLVRAARSPSDIPDSVPIRTNYKAF